MVPVVALLAMGGGVVRAQNGSTGARVTTRIVHRFDFDERDDGNLEDVPMFWEMLRPAGFPHYAHGRFDPRIGHDSPPSFHLASEGRNVAFQYTGSDTPVRSNTDYRIEAAIRPDRLVHARACVSAHFLNKKGEPIAGTVVRSRFVGGRDESSDWANVKLFLPAAPPEAYAIGVIAWVMQEPAWNASQLHRRYISRNDVMGGAWFDDITIFALPRVELSTTGLGNVLTADEPQTLWVVLADNEDASLNGRLRIETAGGVPVKELTVPVVMESPAEPMAIPVEHLDPGLYHARFDVYANRAHILSRSLQFARLGPRFRTSEASARPFGLVIEPSSRAAPEVEFALLKHQVARSAKLPVWTGLPEDPPTVRERREMDRLLQNLVKEGFALTGVFFGPPAAVAKADGAYVRPLNELLAADPLLWREHLATVVAPYASAFRWWQMGGDTGEPPTAREDFTQAAINLREAMQKYITLLRLASATSTAVAMPDVRLPIEQLAVTLGSGASVHDLPEYVAERKSSGYDSVSVYIEPLAPDRYHRLPRLADWSQRVLTARHASADTVYVPQTWRQRDTSQGPVTEPQETYLLLRTIADVVGPSKPAGRLYLAEDLECLVFEDGDSVVLAIWDYAAPPEGRPHEIQLGAADRSIDLWGRVEPLKRGRHGQHVLRLSAMPVLVPGVEKWLVDFRGSLSLTPSAVQSGSELVQHKIQMNYAGARVIAGRIDLRLPEYWDVSPRNFTFNLMPQLLSEHPIRVHYPHNEPAGRRDIVASVQIQGGYYLEVPLAVEIGVDDLHVWGSGVVEGDALVLNHTVTNRSSEVLSIRASAVVPGHERQYRPISNLRPGETQSVEYHFKDGKKLIGRTVMLILREINDGPRKHNLAVSIP